MPKNNIGLDLDINVKDLDEAQAKIKQTEKIAQSSEAATASSVL